MLTIKQRVQALSEAQRIALARLLESEQEGPGGSGNPAVEKQLVGFVTAVNGENLNPEMLRGYLREKLPAYMIPDTFIILAELPRTPNGKIDRQALLAVDISTEDDVLAGDYAAPRNRLEEELVEIWAELLGFDMIGIHDEFFDLGGHSLLAMQVVSRIWQKFRVEISVRTFFEDPTIAGLAKNLKNYALDSDLLYDGDREEFTI
jgi:acyl carrier protein